MADIHTQFQVQDNGLITILLDDPTFVRAETVLVNLRSGEISALLQQKLHSLGEAPDNVVRAFCKHTDVLLSATRIDGSSLSLKSHLVFMN